MHVPSFCWNWYWNINHVSLEIGQVRYNKTRVIASQTNFSGTISSLLHISLRFIELFHVFRNKQRNQEDYCLARTARFSQFSGKRLLIQVWWLDSISRVAGHEFLGRDRTEVSVFTIFLTLVWVENVRGHLQAPSCQTLKMNCFVFLHPLGRINICQNISTARMFGAEYNSKKPCSSPPHYLSTYHPL